MVQKTWRMVMVGITSLALCRNYPSLAEPIGMVTIFYFLYSIGEGLFAGKVFKWEK